MNYLDKKNIALDRCTAYFSCYIFRTYRCFICTRNKIQDNLFTIFFIVIIKRCLSRCKLLTTKISYLVVYNGSICNTIRHLLYYRPRGKESTEV